MEIIDLFMKAVKVVIPLLPIIFKLIILAVIFIVIFGPLFKWGLRVIKDLKRKKEEEG